MLKEREAEGKKKLSVGKRISDLAKITGGENISICAKDYGDKLKDISRRIKNHVENSFILRQIPRPESISVNIDPAARASEKDSGEEKVLDFRTSGRRLIFKGPVPQNVHIQIEYEPL